MLQIWKIGHQDRAQLSFYFHPFSISLKYDNIFHLLVFNYAFKKYKKLHR